MFLNQLAVLSLMPCFAMATDIQHLHGNATNLFNHEIFNKVNVPNRLYADVLMQSDAVTDQSGSAWGPLGSGSEEAGDDGIFHFQARCWAVRGDYLLVGAHLVQLPDLSGSGAPPSGDRRQLTGPEHGCSQSQQAHEGNPNSNAYNKPDSCWTLFAACCFAPPCASWPAYVALYNAPGNPQPGGPNRLLTEAEDCIDLETCQPGTRAVYAFSKVGDATGSATGFKMMDFDYLHCSDFGDVVDSIERPWDEMDTLLTGGFTMEPVESDDPVYRHREHAP